MIYRLKILFFIPFFCLMVLIFACDDKPQKQKQTAPQTVSRKITTQVIKPKESKSPVSSLVDKNKLKNGSDAKSKIIKKDSKNKTIEIKDLKQTTQSDQKLAKKPTQKPAKVESEHYNSIGKIDPFKPLIQEKSQENTPVVDKNPKRILTPLEKIELSQIRLVAVIIMENRRIAMVEEASGKGYEVKIGTYIGKNQGKVFEIKQSSIVVKEPVKDYKGRLIEKVQEIKLHKMDEEG